MSEVKKGTYVTDELLSELDGILEEKAEESALFDDFSKDLAENAPVPIVTIELSPEKRSDKERELYLQERRNNQNTPLPDSVDPE